MKAFNTIQSRTAVLKHENIDTDRIIPARFLTTTERKGLGKFAFHDWRFHQDGALNAAFELNQSEAKGCEILVAGHNFGCGSSREHAPWALLDFGFRAVLSSQIADIFRGNALKNGLLALVIQADLHHHLINNPGIELQINLQACNIVLPDGANYQFEVDAFSRECLLAGVDQLGLLQRHLPQILAFEAARGISV